MNAENLDSNFQIVEPIGVLEKKISLLFLVVQRERKGGEEAGKLE